MIPILEGILNIGAHVYSEIGNFAVFKAFV